MPAPTAAAATNGAAATHAAPTAVPTAVAPAETDDTTPAADAPIEPNDDSVEASVVTAPELADVIAVPTDVAPIAVSAEPVDIPTVAPAVPFINWSPMLPGLGGLIIVWI